VPIPTKKRKRRIVILIIGHKNLILNPLGLTFTTTNGVLAHQVISMDFE
jgi:hypothetical protein